MPLKNSDIYHIQILNSLYVLPWKYNYCFRLLKYLLKCLFKSSMVSHMSMTFHDDVIKWKHFPRYWPFVREFTGPGEFPAQRPVTRSFDVFFDPRLNKRLSKQWWGWWFETPSWSLWRQCNVSVFHLHMQCFSYSFINGAALLCFRQNIFSCMCH